MPFMDLGIIISHLVALEFSEIAQNNKLLKNVYINCMCF